MPYNNDKDKVKKGKKNLKKEVKEKGSKKMSPAKTKDEAISQMKKAGDEVISTRQEIKRMYKEPKGHFNKKVIGSPEKLRKQMIANLPSKVKTRDSLRGVVRNWDKSKLKK